MPTHPIQFFNIEHSTKAKIVAQTSKLHGNFHNEDSKMCDFERDTEKVKLAFQNVEGYDDSPLDEFDRAVLGIIIIKQGFGNRYTTVNIIHRALIGKPGRGDEGLIPHTNQKEAIIHSVIKLMSTVVDFSGGNESLKEMRYVDKDGNEIILRATNLLSADFLDAKINR